MSNPIDNWFGDAEPTTPQPQPEAGDTEATVTTNGVTFTVDLPTLINAYYGDPEYAPTDKITEAAARLLVQSLNLGGVVRDEVRILVREKAEQVVADTLNAGVQPTNTWGEPNGTPVSLRELLAKEVNSFMTTLTGDPYRSNGRQTRLQSFVTEQVDGILRKEMLAEVEAGKKQVLAAIKAQAAQVITETVARMGGVR